jgi:hypothetical protein
MHVGLKLAYEGRRSIENDCGRFSARSGRRKEERERTNLPNETRAKEV